MMFLRLLCHYTFKNMLVYFSGSFNSKNNVKIKLDLQKYITKCQLKK